LGIGNSGAADRISYYLTNLLLYNATNSATLEIILGLLKLKVLVDTNIALGGADMQVMCEGKLLSNWSRHRVYTGDVLSFAYAQEGQIAYLAIEQGFSCPRIFDSVSVNLREGLGRALMEGDILCGMDSLQRQKIQGCSVTATLRSSVIPHFKQSSITLRYVAGYQEKYFDKQAFNNTQFVISNRYDKMGYCFEGAPIIPARMHFISEGITYGAIQVTHTGTPIVLLNERQTIGGYPKIGTVLPIDCYRLVQYGAGTKVRFQELSFSEAYDFLEPNSLKEIPDFLYRVSMAY